MKDAEDKASQAKVSNHCFLHFKHLPWICPSYTSLLESVGRFSPASSHAGLPSGLAPSAVQGLGDGQGGRRRDSSPCYTCYAAGRRQATPGDAKRRRPGTHRGKQRTYPSYVMQTSVRPLYHSP